MHVYELMAEPIRRRLVEVLASGAHFAFQLEEIVVAEFGVGRSAAQHHLKVLRDHEFVRVFDDWPHRHYQLEPETLEELARELENLEHLWARRIGWRETTDPLHAADRPSRRGYRGRGRDPDARVRR